MSQHLETKGEDEFKENRSFIQFDSTHHIPSINIHLSTIDNTSVGFQVLLRKWSREKMSKRHRLTFDLPETLTFAQCSVSLDAMYKSMPFCLDSALAHGLSTDLKLLAKSKLEVVQLVPISSIDASLLFGVAIGVRAGFEHDLDQHNEMGLLVRTLFKQLVSKDCALLLLSKGPPDSEEAGLFHSPEGQSWLLMAEEIPAPLKEQTAPNSGVLYRMASGDHFILEASPADIITSDNDGDNPFFEYVEASMDYLGCAPVNPLYLEAKSFQQKSPRALKDRAFIKTQETAWTDKKTGGGSLKKTATSQVVETLPNSIGASKAGNKEESNDGNKVIGWNDDSGVGLRERGCSQESEEIVDSESEANGSPRKGGSRTILTTNSIQKEVIAKTASSSKQPVDDEVEWTDDTGGYCSPDSESEDSDARDAGIGVFNYSQ
jgi:hypothetical protein